MASTTAPTTTATAAATAPRARPNRVESAYQLIGNTPVVRLNRLTKADEHATIWLKLESANPGGSVKDRIALGMLEDAERSGALKPGMTVLEATSGNTGIGLAFVATAKGYPVTLVMPETMTTERRALLKAYGAELVLTGAGGMKVAVEKAKELSDAAPGKYWMVRQFENEANPAYHRNTTAVELLEQVPELDAFVAGIGTGGTITGVGQVLRAQKPGVRIVGVEPESSPLLTKGTAGPNKIQGIGANFVPAILDRAVYDAIIDVSYEDAIAVARRLAREEALLSGISTGAIVHAALQVAKELGPGKTVVAVLCDTGERYLSHELYTEIDGKPASS